VPGKDFIMAPNYAIPAGSGATLYFRLQSRGIVQFPAVLHTHNEYMRSEQNTLMLDGFYFGAALIFIIYALVTFIMRGEKTSLFFACYMLSLAVYQFCAMGYGKIYLWDGSNYVQNHIMGVALGLLGAFVALFTNRFIAFGMALRRLVQCCFAVYIACAVFALFNVYYGILLACILIIAGCVVLFGLCIYATIRKKTNAAGFLLVWLVTGIGALIQTFKNMDILPINAWTDFALQAGVLFQIITLSVLMALDSRREYLAAASAFTETQIKARVLAGIENLPDDIPESNEPLEEIEEATKKKPTLLQPLTGWELHIARLAQKRLTTKEIAVSLSTTPGTIQTALHIIYEKLDIHSKYELASLDLS
jgi:DNA-binding CsgD family transcriptional regulator